MAIWHLYLIRTRQNALYTGITTDVLQRLAKHKTGKQGAKYLRSKGPLQLVYHTEIGNRSTASSAEYRLKKLTKPQKESIVSSNPNKQALLTLLKIDIART